MTDETLPSATGSATGQGGKLRWLVIASLAVNLLLVGALVGPHLFGHRPWRGGERSGEEFGLMGYARHLPKERRKMIRSVVEAERGSLKSLRDEIRKARVEAGEVLVSEPFDAERLKSAVDRIGAAEAKLKSAGLAVFLNAAQQLTAEERKGLLEHWKRRRPNFFRPPDEDGRPQPVQPPKD